MRIEKLLPILLPYVPGCTDNIALQSIRMAAREFCRKTDFVKQAATANLVDGQTEYTFTPNRETVFLRLMTVEVDGGELDSSLYEFTAASGVMTLDNEPDHDTTSGVAVSVSTQPTMTAMSIDDALGDYYGDVIVAGAKAYLMKQPEKPYSNPALAAESEREFRIGIVRALNENKIANKQQDISIDLSPGRLF